MYTMTPARAKRPAKNHIKRDKPILCVFENTTDAELKIPTPVQEWPVRIAVLCLRNTLDLFTNHAVPE